MQFDNSAQVDFLATLPPEPPKPAASKWNGWSAPLRALASGAAETGAALAESVKAFGQVAGAAGADSAGGMFSTQSATERQQSETARQQIASQGLRGTSESSTSLRNVAEQYSPDPATAGMAEKLVFGALRPISKAVGYGLTTGPAAPFLFGLDEGLATTDQLQRQGVDTATASQAGMVTGAANAAGFLIPVAGETKLATAALATISGPAAFIAQQATTREILRRADYQAIGDQFDPLDPVGLAMSGLPFGFGAWAMRARIRGGAPHAADIPRAPAERPVDAGRSDGGQLLRDQPAGDVPAGAARAADEGTARPVPDGNGTGRVPDAVAHEAVDAAMVHNLTQVADHAETYTSKPLESLAEFAARVEQRPAPGRASAGPDPFLAWLNAQGGVNFADKFDITGEANAVRLNRGRVFRRDGLGLDELAVRAESEGWLPPGSTQDIDGGVPQLRDMLQRSMQGERVRDIQGQTLHAEQAGQMHALEQHVAALERRLETLGVDPSPARGDPEILQAYLDQHEPRLIRQVLGEQQADSASLTDPTPSQRAAEGSATDVPTPQKLGAQESAPRSPEGSPSVRQPAEPGNNATAAPVETGAGPDAALIDSVRGRAADVVSEAPDLVVGTREDGTPITAREALEQIRREAAEGTDAELGSQDAPLLDVAIRCALSQGE